MYHSRIIAEIITKALPQEKKEELWDAMFYKHVNISSLIKDGFQINIKAEITDKYPTNENLSWIPAISLVAINPKNNRTLDEKLLAIDLGEEHITRANVLHKAFIGEFGDCLVSYTNTSFDDLMSIVNFKNRSFQEALHIEHTEAIFDEFLKLASQDTVSVIREMAKYYEKFSSKLTKIPKRYLANQNMYESSILQSRANLAFLEEKALLVQNTLGVPGESAKDIPLSKEEYYFAEWFFDIIPGTRTDLEKPQYSNGRAFNEVTAFKDIFKEYKDNDLRISF